MARNTSVSLGDHFTAFIDDKVREGRYASASDVIRAGLRLLEEEEAKLARLRALIAEGDASGYPEEPFDFDAFLADTNAKHRA
jgi:antitoxin ParD1/3/4